jgi:hypothetical protein
MRVADRIKGRCHSANRNRNRRAENLGIASLAVLYVRTV